MRMQRLMRRLGCLLGMHFWSFNGSRLLSLTPVYRAQITWLCAHCNKVKREVR